jgi:hypothetical protein
MLVLVSWLLLGPPAAAREPAWQRNRVVVYDYTSAAWGGVIAQTVAEFNDMLPKNAPRLIYVRRTAVPCEAIPTRRRKGDSLVVCSTTLIVHAGQTAGPRLVQLADAPINPLAGTACHEFMHALTGIGDNYVLGIDGGWTWITPGLDSCVWGWSTKPGSFDVAYAKKVYGKKKRR